MHELLSWLMLMTDEAWLNHAARIRAHATVSAQDVELEEMLFECERLFNQMHAQQVAATQYIAASPAMAPVPAGKIGRASHRD